MAIAFLVGLCCLVLWGVVGFFVFISFVMLVDPNEHEVGPVIACMFLAGVIGVLALGFTTEFAKKIFVLF